ncbi:holin [Xanthomonas phage vB_XooS_NR08]|nr:holin [Xanthomonas phage vB_XooS_NR08]
MPSKTKNKLQQLKSNHMLEQYPARLNRIDPSAWQGGKTVRETECNYSSSKWRKLRAMFLKSNPLCVYCLEDNRTTAATVVDHIVAHRGDIDLFWSEDNLQPLCQQCHSSRKQSEERSAGYY